MQKIGGFNEKFVAGEDHDLFQRLTKVGRTRFIKGLTVYHTGRRAHKIGWPRLLSIWLGNVFSFIFLKRSMSKEWKEIR